MTVKIMVKLACTISRKAVERFRLYGICVVEDDLPDRPVILWGWLPGKRGTFAGEFFEPTFDAQTLGPRLGFKRSLLLRGKINCARHGSLLWLLRVLC